jgi:outer membrane immunogenic protein
MNKFVSAFAGLLAFAASIGGASAADLSRPAPYYTKAPPYVMPVNNWTGFYAGINGGFGWGTSNWSGIPSSFDTSGGLVGGQIGYNWQFGQFVYGLEGDADWSDIRSNSSAALCGGIACETRNDFLSTVRGRIGVPFADRWMPYFTGGLAIGNIRTTTPNLTGIDQTNAGWTIGGGVEFALAGNWTAKVEYLYVDLGNAGCGINCGLPANSNVSFTANIVRGGINYRF